MKIRISHQGPQDLIVQSNGGPSFRIPPSSWWDWWRRKSDLYDISKNEIVVLRADGSKEPDGVETKTAI